MVGFWNGKCNPRAAARVGLGPDLWLATQKKIGGMRSYLTNRNRVYFFAFTFRPLLSLW